MPSLIEVPKSKEEIAAFLADGQTRGIPFITNADINDGDILAQTSTIDLGGGSYKFSINLPSGRNLESAPVGPDYPKRDATFQWVDAVRSAFVGDAEQAAEETFILARQREPIEAPVFSSPDRRELGHPSGASRQPAITDPVEYAKQQLHLALERLAAVASAEADVERWGRVVKAFSGEIVSAGTKKRKKRKHKKTATKAV